MDIQPILSPFNPALSYSLLVDDFFNLEDQSTTTIFTDDEAIDYEDYNNNNLVESEDLSNFKDKEDDIKPSTDLRTDVMEEQSVEEIIVFDPHISDGKELTELEAMDISQDVKGDITNYIFVKCQDNADDNRSCLLSSLCSTIDQSPANISFPNDIKGQHQMTTSPLLGSSPGPLSPMLPPCRVCGEKASGFHYGANTCEACKGFFRRSLQRKQSYRCLGSNDCDISSGKRNVCAACRYRKCLSLGMSKTAIKTGRYTHAKKTKDIQEVKRLQRKQLLREEQTDSSQLLPCSVHSDVIDDETAEEILDKIMNVHRQQTPHTPEFFEKLSQKEQDYLIRRKLKEEMFGPLRPISQDEYSNIYHCTGIDVDGRKAMLEHMLPCIERAVKRFVTFAKAVPGFKDLPLEDQIKLIKGSRFEAWLISSYRAFNSEHLLYTHYCGSTVHLENMSRLYDESFLRDVFKGARDSASWVSNTMHYDHYHHTQECNLFGHPMVGDIKKLDLTEEEECMLKAILIFFRDRSLLQDPDLVDVHQTRLIQTLSIIHRKRKPKDRIFFGKVSAVLTEMRTLTDIHTTQENKIQVEWATDVPIPPLLYELFYV